VGDVRGQSTISDHKLLTRTAEKKLLGENFVGLWQIAKRVATAGVESMTVLENGRANVA
jgi:hypothetical protein